MNSANRPVVGVLLGLSIVAACRGSDTVTPDASMGSGSDSGGPTEIHIQDVQSDKMAPGTAFDLHNVVVTAVDTFGTRTASFWVEEPGGGPFSGVQVFVNKQVDILAAVVPGDLVNITGGVKSEFTITGDMSGRSVTEVQSARNGMLTVTKVGTGTVPAPMVVDAFKIGLKATQSLRDTEWEPWEGVLVKVDNVMAFGTPSCITSQGNCTDPSFASFTITGVVKAESALSGFPTPEVKIGDCFSSVTGVVDYAFDYLILPRTTAEIATGGTSCPQRETGAAALCTDGADNDGNGFGDCKDFGCQAGAGAWLGASCAPADAMCGCSANLALGVGVNKVNTGSTGPVLLHDVFVTAVGATGYWVADALQAAPNGGVFVFTGVDVAPAADIVIGAKLPTLQGISSVFGTAAPKLAEISTATAGTIGVGGDPIAITSATAAQLVDAATGAPYAGSLVTLTNLKVSVVANDANQIKLKDNNNTVITMDDGAFVKYGGGATVLDIPLGTCFASLTGVMDVQTKDAIRTINPRLVADMISTGGTCN